MKFSIKLSLLALSALLILPLAACQVTQTEEGEMPEVEVKEGKLPEYDVDGPDIDVGTKETEVTVPDVDVSVEGKKKKVTVPDIDVTTPGDPDYENDDPDLDDDVQAPSNQ
jgi:hypothetical protein